MKSVVLLSYWNTLTYVFNTWGLQTVVLWATSLFMMSGKYEIICPKNLSELNALGHLITWCFMV